MGARDKMTSEKKKQKPKKEKRHAPISLRNRKQTQNPQQVKINRLLRDNQKLNNRRKAYFEETTVLKARNKQLLVEREQFIAKLKINQDKAHFYDQMIQLNLDLHTFFSADDKVLAKHSDVIAIKEKIVE